MKFLESKDQKWLLLLGVATVVVFGLSWVLVPKRSEQSVLQEQTEPSASTSIMSPEEAIERVSRLPEVRQYVQRVPNGKVRVDHEDEGTYSIQVYEIKDGHTATLNWYEVDKVSGEISSLFEYEEISE